MRLMLSCFLVLLAGCSTIQVRSPECVPPPLPPELLKPCPDPELPTEGSFGGLYLLTLKNTGPWGQCMRLHDQMVGIYRYQQQVVQQCLDRLSQSQANDKPWYKFWGN